MDHLVVWEWTGVSASSADDDESEEAADRGAVQVGGRDQTASRKANSGGGAGQKAHWNHVGDDEGQNGVYPEAHWESCPACDREYAETESAGHTDTKRRTGSVGIVILID